MTDRAVLFSIKPKYCELIASGKKTVEVRKTRPKIAQPFKCYIYCTKDFYRKGDGYFQGKCCGKVIGEFVCDVITSLKCDNGYHAAYNRYHNTCLTDDEIMKYANNGTAHYLHISDLVIYDNPKELSEFKKYNRTCHYSELGFAIPKCSDCRDCNLKRPPQSWCYVEDKQ